LWQARNLLVWLHEFALLVVLVAKGQLLALLGTEADLLPIE